MENSKSSFSIRAEHCSECVCVKLYLITSKHSSCFCVLAMTNHCQKKQRHHYQEVLSPFLLSTVPKAGDHFLLTRFYLFPGQSSNHPGTLLVFPQFPPATPQQGLRSVACRTWNIAYCCPICWGSLSLCHIPSKASYLLGITLFPQK